MGEFYKKKILIILNYLDNPKKIKAKFKTEFSWAKN